MLLNLQDRTEWTTGMLQLHKQGWIAWQMAQSMNNGNSISCDWINYQVHGKIQTLSKYLLEGGLLLFCSRHILLGEGKKIRWLKVLYLLLLLVFFLFSLSFFKNSTFISNKQQLIAFHGGVTCAREICRWLMNLCDNIWIW